MSTRRERANRNRVSRLDKPKMGWQAKLALNKQALANQQSGANSVRTNETARMGQNKTFELGQSTNRIKNRGQNQVFQLGQDRNRIDSTRTNDLYALGSEKNRIDSRSADTRRDVADSSIATNTQAFGVATNRENARQSYASSLESGNEADIESTRRNLDTFGYQAPKQGRVTSELDNAKLQQTDMANYNKFSARYQVGDPRGSWEEYKKVKDKQSGFSQGFTPNTAKPKGYTRQQYRTDMDDLF